MADTRRADGGSASGSGGAARLGARPNAAAREADAGGAGAPADDSYDSADEAEWFDACAHFADDPAYADLSFGAAHATGEGLPPPPAPTSLAQSSVPLPTEPLDDDDWLPPNTVSDKERAAAVAALRARILATPDAGTPTCALPPIRFRICALTCARCRADAVAPYEDRSPATLERFLRARDYDVDVAAALMLEHRAWRVAANWAVGIERVTPADLASRKIALQALSRRGEPLLIIVASRHSKCALVPSHAALLVSSVFELDADLRRSVFRRDNRDMVDVRNYIVYTMDKARSLRDVDQLLSHLCAECCRGSRADHGRHPTRPTVHCAVRLHWPLAPQRGCEGPPCVL